MSFLTMMIGGDAGRSYWLLLLSTARVHHGRKRHQSTTPRPLATVTCPALFVAARCRLLGVPILPLGISPGWRSTVPRQTTLLLQTLSGRNLCRYCLSARRFSLFCFSRARPLSLGLGFCVSHYIYSLTSRIVWQALFYNFLRGAVSSHAVSPVHVACARATGLISAYLSL